MSDDHRGQPLTKVQRQDTIFIDCALIALGLIGSFIGQDAASFTGVPLGIGLIVWSVWWR
jgi:hypothetical protein